MAPDGTAPDRSESKLAKNGKFADLNSERTSMQVTRQVTEVTLKVTQVTLKVTQVTLKVTEVTLTLRTLRYVQPGPGLTNIRSSWIAPL
jgi:hypothetical protein